MQSQPQQPPAYSPVSKKGQEIIRASTLAKWEDLHELMQSIANVKDDLDGLHAAIDRFTAKIPAPWSFYEDLLPKIKQWALEDIQVALPLMRPYNKDTAVCSISPRAVRHLLANVFFMNIELLSPDDRMAHRLGELSYYGLYIRPYVTSVERIACQLAYFYKSVDDAELDARPPIRFERYWPEQAIELRTAFWESSVLSLPPVERINVHALAMEDVPGKAFVDFANKFIHIGCIIPSLTQEEVLFSCCPEAFLCLLFISELRDQEVVIIRNARRYSTYTGYLDRFRWTGFWPTVRLHDLLVIDACVSGQFKSETVIRDLEKAFLSFAPIKDDRISTGHWGCGAFGGDKTLKFLQQLCAAAAANSTLDYSTYMDEPLAKALHELHVALLEKKVTVGRIVRTIPRFLHQHARVSEFAGWIKQELLKDKEEDDAKKEAKEGDEQFDPDQESEDDDGKV